MKGKVVTESHAASPQVLSQHPPRAAAHVAIQVAVHLGPLQGARD